MEQASKIMSREQGEDRFSTLLVETEPTSIEAEAVRSLRTRILAQHVREGRRALTICTPSDETGCSFVAANLAVSIAQIGFKVALVDGDLRQPTISEMFGLEPTKAGLTNFLTDDSLEIDDVLQTTHRPHLSIVAAGSLVSNPQELLSSSRFKLFVDQMLREFDLTIFDTTPTSRCTDAQRVANVSGYSLIVARRHATFMSDVSTLVKLLRADRSVVVGSVLNDF